MTVSSFAVAVSPPFRTALQVQLPAHWEAASSSLKGVTLAVTRARKVQHFLSRMFFVAALFAGAPGVFLGFRTSISVLVEVWSGSVPGRGGAVARGSSGYLKAVWREFVGSTKWP